ncbi:DUF4852 domain-containing protein [uncultured Pseudodesulfovibrio sp.]|uniref:DUF4852 domain-containing protein n=1 Tax=uncultured Pseudodesulfovibrio sp. TaxID=2035858 RepID=UPI0029C850E8|nr:DUF4852 domain-containing protein [uncultured Pseudodesulfovibrio sp.]
MKNTIQAIALTVCALIISSGFAHGADWHRLAYSKKMGAEVFADQAGGSWCKDAVSVKVNLDDNSPLLKGGIEGFLIKVGTVITNDCSSATSARFDVFKNGGTTPMSSYTGTSSNGWTVTPLETKGKALDEIAVTPPKEAPAPSIKEESIKPVQAEYLNLIQGVMPSSQSVLSNPDAIFDYLKLKHCKEYSSAKSNEIKLAKLGKSYTQEATAFLDKPSPEYITLSIRSKVGKYNLQKKAFPFQPLKEDATFSFDRPSSWRCPSNQTFPKKITLKINGGEFIQELPMSPDEAESLLKTLSYREVLITATLKIFRWDQYAGGNDDAVVHTILHSAKIINKRTGKAFYEFPHSWLGAKIEKKQAALMEAEKARQQQLEEEKTRKAQEAAARADRIERGVEPLVVNGNVALAHFNYLSSPTDTHMVNGIDVRRPLAIEVSATYNKRNNSVALGNTERQLQYQYKADNGERVNIVIQNWKEFVKQNVPQDVLAQIKKKPQDILTLVNTRAGFMATPVGYKNDPWKGGKGVVVYVSETAYAVKVERPFQKSNWINWSVKANSSKQKYVQKQDTRTARELDVAGLHGGMEIGDVQDILEDKLQLETRYNESTKVLKSPEELFVSDFFNKDTITSGLRYFEGKFVQTGKSLMGLGSPVYSLKQATLKQTASIEEREAIIEGLVKKFGEPDLSVSRSDCVAFTWGKRITDDRSNIPTGKNLQLPVSAVEAQIYSNGKEVLTVLTLTDELYLKKTKITTKTVY